MGAATVDFFISKIDVKKRATAMFVLPSTYWFVCLRAYVVLIMSGTKFWSEYIDAKIIKHTINNADNLDNFFYVSVFRNWAFTLIFLLTKTVIIKRRRFKNSQEQSA